MAGLMEGQGKQMWPGQGYEDSRFELRDPISSSFHCPICMNVLNDPVMCRTNQHYFCKACITRHLTNTHNCPTCQDELTEESLVLAPRIVVEYLSELKIRCDFFNRGCHDVMKLSVLQGHVRMCGFAAVKCSNEGCEVIINRQDKLHHEAEICEFRKLKCHDCVELKTAVKNINEKMTEDLAIIKRQVDDYSRKMTENNINLQKQVDDVSIKISKMCEIQTKMMLKVTEIMTEVKQLSQIIPGQPLVRKNIIIAGGENPKAINSVEIFSLSQKSWGLIRPMSISRSQASAVTYKDEVIISGGNTIETSSCHQFSEWKISPAKIPEKCHRHATVIYKDSLLLSGGKISGHKTSNMIFKISMIPPYSTKILTTMPEARCDHTMELFQDKLYIFGGYNTGAHNTVMMVDLVTKQWKMLTPLPFKVDEMATVLWQNNVIVLGGRSSSSDSKDTVVMYNLTTGKSKYLPSMKHKRRGCTAVVTGNVVVVMGGLAVNYLKSVEVFLLEDQVWVELPDMNEPRCYACAVVKPS